MRVLKNARANLENKRKIFLEIGFVIALAGVIAAFEFRTYEPYEIPETGFATEFIDEDVTDITFQKPKPPEAIPQRRPTPINIVDDSEDIDDTPEIDASDDFDDPNQDWEPPIDDEPEIDDPNRIFIAIQKMPNFTGGESELFKYLRNTIQYPKQASELRMSGIVYVSFVVEKDGSITNIVVERGVNGGCSEEAVRAIENMPKWEPGIQSGKKVRCKFTLPVKFVLRQFKTKFNALL